MQNLVKGMLSKVAWHGARVAHNRALRGAQVNVLNTLGVPRQRSFVVQGQSYTGGVEILVAYSVAIQHRYVDVGVCLTQNVE